MSETRKSGSLNGLGVIEAFFHPSVNIDMAVAQITKRHFNHASSKIARMVFSNVPAV